MDRPWVERVAAVGSLGDPIRRRLYEHVVAGAEPVGRDAAAAALGLARSTAAFHLDRLAAEGLLTVEYKRLGGRSGPGAGRPAKLYRRAEGEIAVSVPERRYDVVGELLAAAVQQSTRTGTPVQDVLPATAREAGRRMGATEASLVEALAAHGFEPRPDDAGGWVLGNCPFHALARRYTDLVCGLNLELLRGLAEGVADGAGHAAAAGVEPEAVEPAVGLAMVLDPAPGRCCVRAARTASAASQP